MGKKELGGIKNLKAFTSCHGGVVARLDSPLCHEVFLSVGFRVKKKD